MHPRRQQILATFVLLATTCTRTSFIVPSTFADDSVGRRKAGKLPSSFIRGEFHRSLRNYSGSSSYNRNRNRNNSNYRRRMSTFSKLKIIWGIALVLLALWYWKGDTIGGIPSQWWSLPLILGTAVTSATTSAAAKVTRARKNNNSNNADSTTSRRSLDHSSKKKRRKKKSVPGIVTVSSGDSNKSHRPGSRSNRHLHPKGSDIGTSLLEHHNRSRSGTSIVTVSQRPDSRSSRRLQPNGSDIDTSLPERHNLSRSGTSIVTVSQRPDSRSNRGQQPKGVIESLTIERSGSHDTRPKIYRAPSITERDGDKVKIHVNSQISHEYGSREIL